MSKPPSPDQNHIFQDGCVPFNDRSRTPYGYQPSPGIGIACLAVFATSLAIHLFQTIRRRRTTSIFFTAAAFVEYVGWSGRTWSSPCPYNRHPFTIQLITLTVAPAFILLGGLLTLRLCMIQNPKRSTWLSMNVCFSILSGFIAFSTAVQVTGTVLAVRELHTMRHTAVGAIIALAGYATQLYTILITSLFVLFHTLQPTRHNPLLAQAERLVLIAISISSFALLVRSIYHITGFIQGWNGTLNNHQWYFVGLDAVMAIIALGVYNVIDPTVLLGSRFYHMPKTICWNNSSAKSEIIYRGTKFEMLNPKTTRQVNVEIV